MVIHRAYRFRMYPTKEQKVLLNKFLGTSRFIYNYYLNEKKRRYEENKLDYKLYDMIKDLKGLQVEYPWLKNIDSCILRTSLFNLEDAYQRFYKNQNSFPKFKKKTYLNSYRTNCIKSTYKGHEYSNIKVNLETKTITLPKLKEIKIKGYRNLKTFEDKRIINATISNVANKYYVAVCVEENITSNEFILRNVIGLDLGVKDTVITSDGLKYKAMQNMKKIEKKLKGLNRWLARSKKGSNNRLKIIKKIQRVNEKIKNIRKYYLHLITRDIVNNNDVIITEKLQIKEMIEKSTKPLTKSLTNTSLGEIIRQIKYKCEWSNKKLIQVNTYYPSSQLCNVCGSKNSLVKDLSIRKWTCKHCNNDHDRDINASLNILEEGIKLYFKEQVRNA